MATPFENVYNVFLNSITDFDLASMEDEKMRDLLFLNLKSAVSKFKECRKDLSKYNQFSEMFTEDLSDEEVEILSILMVSEWYAPQINNVTLTKQFLSDKDYRVFSQANHLDSMVRARKEAKREANQMIVDYTYRNEKK